MRNLDKLIIYFINNFPRDISRTELVKLVYKFEYHHTIIYGKDYTGIEFERYYYGPYSETIIECVTDLVHNKYIDCECYINKKRNKLCYSYRKGKVSLPVNSELDSNVIYIADYLIDKYGDKSLDEMLEDVYTTGPMSIIQREENNRGIKCYGRRIDMADKSHVLEFSLNELIDAEKRINSKPIFKPDSSNIDEFLEFKLNSFSEMDDLRRRVNYVNDMD